MSYRFARATIAIRVAVAPVVMMASLVVVAALGLWTTRDLRASLTGLSERTLPDLAQMSEIERKVAASYAAINQSLAVADGDLRLSDVAAATGDETMQVLTALAEVSRQLGGIVSEVRSAAAQVDSASSEIAQGNVDLSACTEQQAVRLQQVAVSIEQITASGRHNAEQAHEAHEADGLALDASQAAEDGALAVAEVVRTMDELNVQSTRISEITGLIDVFAFQTNILALDAAVEAARAGEQRRGFAVVASEVRNLAGRSSAAAKEICSLISASVESTQGGNQRAKAAGAKMTQIASAISRATAVMGEIAAASGHQADDIAQVNRSVGQIDQSTQQNAVLVEQAAAAAAAESLHDP